MESSNHFIENCPLPLKNFISKVFDKLNLYRNIKDNIEIIKTNL